MCEKTPYILYGLFHPKKREKSSNMKFFQDFFVENFVNSKIVCNIAIGNELQETEEELIC